MKLIDKYNRTHNYLRLSVSDKCNLHCLYCNPVSSELNLSKDSLTNQEIIRLTRLFIKQFEFSKIRLTGGEPFARKNIIELFEGLSVQKNEYQFELAVTTNGTLLNGKLKKLKELGLDRFNFSLDSLKHQIYSQITGKNELSKVLQTIDEAESEGFQNTKINTVIIRRVNDDEISDFIEYSIRTSRNIRFIEYMPFSNNGYDKDGFISSKELINTISQSYKLLPFESNSMNVAKDYCIIDTKAKISFISPISDHFCELCNRLRITSDGKLKLCLFSPHKTEIDLLKLIRDGYTDEQIADSISKALLEKDYAHPEIEELIQLKNNNIISLGG
ncbi:MAG: GTP 3',8-cyclase MoaA [Bacteroidetes bacterium]|nr:GTP 3',8-cyclase MoaA [Bacteroidota bacterium]